jgi:hypothetical protein
MLRQKWRHVSAHLTPLQCCRIGGDARTFSVPQRAVCPAPAVVTTRDAAARDARARRNVRACAARARRTRCAAAAPAAARWEAAHVAYRRARGGALARLRGVARSPPRAWAAAPAARSCARRARACAPGARRPVRRRGCARGKRPRPLSQERPRHGACANSFFVCAAARARRARGRAAPKRAAAPLSTHKARAGVAGLGRPYGRARRAACRALTTAAESEPQRVHDSLGVSAWRTVPRACAPTPPAALRACVARPARPRLTRLRPPLRPPRSGSVVCRPHARRCRTRTPTSSSRAR